MWFNKCKHVWKCVHVHHIDDISYSSNGSPSTYATFSCIFCGKTMKEYMYAQGYISKEELNSAIDWSKYE